MPTRTALIITIGDVIETRPPRRRKRRLQSVSSSESELEASDNDSVVPIRRAAIMKTRGASTDQANSNCTSNATGERRKLRNHSTNSEHLNGQASPKTRSSTIKPEPPELDEEISFSDSIAIKEENGNDQPVKKKRKSSAEKFLEDNSEYYGIQVLPGKLRSTDTFHNSFLDFLSNTPTEDEMTSDRRRNRHKSATESVSPTLPGPKSKRRNRATSASHFQDALRGRRELRVEVEKMRMDNGLSDSESEDQPRSLRQRERKSARGTRRQQHHHSPSPKSKWNRRSELDKLLEAGSSSFHFETAREAHERSTVEEPLTVDVSDQSNHGSSDSNARPSEPLLVTEAAPRKRGKRPGRPPKNRKMSTEKRNEEDALSLIIPKTTFEELENRLRECDGEAVEVDSLNFAFEHTPQNEPWFQTYTRQDQGDEIVYYPDSQSKPFVLPYEMPITTFYPGGGKKSKNVSDTSAVPSGQVTPDTTATDISRIKKKKRGAFVANSKRLRLKQDRKSAVGSETNGSGSSSVTGSPVKQRIMSRLGPKVANNLLEFSRKSPRGHASTKSLLSAEPGIADIHDECSNDSLVSIVSVESVNNKGHKVESTQEFNKLALTLESFLREEDPTLLTDTDSSDMPPMSMKHRKKRSRKNSERSRHFAECDPMDRLVASNVDSVLLDCLEDEVPSVTFDEEVPGSDALELVENFHKCNLPVTGGRWQKKRKENVALPVLPEKVDTPPPVDSSSEYATSEAGESVTSVESNQSRKKRKRNMTGFPTPKKKKSLLNNVLTKSTITNNVTKKKYKLKVPPIRKRSRPPRTAADDSETDGEVKRPLTRPKLKPKTYNEEVMDKDLESVLADQTKVPVRPRGLKIPPPPPRGRKR